MIRTEFETWRDELNPAKRSTFTLGWIVMRIAACIAIGGALRFSLYAAAWLGERF